MLKLFVIALAILLTEGSEKLPRLLGGQDAHSIVKFPHHVLLGQCAGSIIAQNWILTTKSCISQNKDDIEVQFERFYYGVNVYSLKISRDLGNVKTHPFYDIALIKLPMDLKFGDNLNKIELYKSGLEFDEKTIGVIPGFDDNTSTHSVLKYGMYKFEPLFNNTCKEIPGYDEYTQICSVSYNGYNPVCDRDVGSGLIIGWPENPLLLGILSEGSCNIHAKELFIKVDSFSSWIQTVTGIKPTPGAIRAKPQPLRKAPPSLGRM